jgi:DNA-binding transcriptional ArsR family regulator
MDQSAALAIFESLSSSVRLDVFRLLVKAGPKGVVAGEIASALDIAPSSLSFHLRTLTQSGLVQADQEGRFQRYRADLSCMVEVIGFLTENCCGGVADGCAGPAEVESRWPSCSSSTQSKLNPKSTA